MNINVQAFLDTLPIMGKGMAGIFIVTAILIASIYILNYFGNKLGKNKSDKDN